MVGAAISLTCSDKIVNSGESDAVEFSMSLKFAGGQESLTDVVTTYRVGIIADEDTITADLQYANGLITGLIENVPAGPNRTIIVEGLATDGTVIYRGSVVVEVVADRTVDAVVTLLPVAKLVRVSPNFANRFHGENFTSEIKVNNIQGLTNIEVALDYNSGVVELDSLKRGVNLPEGATFSFSKESGIEISASHSSAIVDSSGDVTVASIFFHSAASNKCLDSSNLDLDVLNLTAPGVSLGDVFIDDGKALINRGRLIVSPDTLSYGLGVAGLNLDFKEVGITDSCGNPVPFTLSTEYDWIDLNTAIAGITPGTVFIDVDTAGLESGNYEGYVLVNSPRSANSPYYIVIKLTLDRGVRNFNISPQLIVFNAIENGALPASRTIHVEEVHQNIISFDVRENAPWMNINKITGVTPDSIFVNILTTGLKPDTYTDTVEISSDIASNSPQFVTVIYRLERGPRVIATDPANLHFVIQQNGLLPESQTFRVYETGGSPISYNAFKNKSWLSLSGVSGITEDTLTVSVTTTNVSPGLYMDSISISSVEADNSPIYVRVSLGVSVVPKTLEVDPDSLHFEYVQNSVDYPTGQFRVSETDGYAISFDAVENVPWLFLSHESGITEDTITVFTQPDLIPGFYVDSIVISSEAAQNSPVYVKVSLEVFEQPKYLVVEPDSLHLEYIQYSDAIPTVHFTVSELNGYPISFEAIENSNWMSLQNVSGITPDEIDVTVDISLEPGVYVDSIKIATSEAVNSPVYIIVVLDIIYMPPPEFDFSPDTLYFSAQEDGSLPASKDFIVSINSYPTPIILTESIPWLDLAYQPNYPSAEVSVFILSTELEEGIYFDSVLASNGGLDYIPDYGYIVYVIIDSISPAPVTDLKVDNNTVTSVFLSWTASGDNINVGTASVTDLRYATDLETLLGWDGATQAEGVPSPQPAGSQEAFEATGLTPGYTYYLAVDIIDDAGNHSGLSNVDSVFLPPLPPTLISPDSGALNIPINVAFLWHRVVNNDAYQLHIDDEPSFISPTISPNIYDTVHIVKGLNYETTYYWRIRAVGHSPFSDWSNVWSFITVAAPPTISGAVRDNEGEPLADALVIAYNDYPTGDVLDSIRTDTNGTFKFFDLIGAVELYAFKDGFYPQTISIDAPDTEIVIFLISTPAFTPSDQWVDLYCDSSYVHGNLIRPNDVIEAFDPQGTLCGRFVVHTEGAYGYMHVYRDDLTTLEIDEGCVTGDAMTLKANGEVALPEDNLIYPSSNQLIEACFNVTGQIPQWIVITKPEGGETFYQDSSVSVEWSSTGITGPVEIALIMAEREIYILDTTGNDSQEMVTVPEGLADANNWQIRVADLDENTVDYSEPFTISSVELRVEPSRLLLNGVTGDCAFDQKQFTVSEKSGFNIPFVISDTIPWLSITPSSGTTPAVVTVQILANSLDVGNYETALPVSSANAVNTPITVSIELDNRQYVCGDFNNDCDVKIGDLSNMIDYLYRDGPAPLFPDALNVDLCDGVDIGDVDFLFTLTFYDRPSLCEGSLVCTDESNDLGAEDSLKFVVAQAPTATDSNSQMQLDLYLFNDANVVNGLASGFVWDNPNLHVDSVKFSPYVQDNLSLKIAFDSDTIDSTNENRRFLFVANKTIFSGIQPSPSQQLLASYFFTLSDWANGDSIYLDTLTFSEGSTYKTVSSNGSYRPTWRGPIVIKESSF